ncbi:transcriptional regulator, AraC family [Pseudomonas synxantha]|uniref:AraC family transcriptional regulator n=1 Tax=Pseudomonas synxantha TaxID=47883 RepID=A0AAX3I0X0_9PSED|nr:AraC family transcriptional regulator [Pseudomonas synxantha]AZE64919.1 Transcriptional regulator, AraC family [Pseudomonas synxantha]KRP49904.1 AraC family transcriptional regulator [Pseudomonas synxantha]SDT96599.1 transcriptional regulator, AraC family [Pseudomonas synxantha]VTQ90443.1 AraC family transcriptional regulator [Pseudomonas synxantha]
MGNPTHTLDWLHRAPHASGLDRIEAYFAGFAFDPHRHDTYAIGRTLFGVQSFHYRGGMTHSLPGTTMVIHPDELHDGRAGSDEGFKYRMIYVEPALIQQILGGKPLPFIPGGLSTDPRLHRASEVLLQNLECSIDPMQEQDAMYDLAQALSMASGAIVSRKSFDYIAAERAREFIHSALGRSITLDEMADHAGRDRWALSRDFRLLFGTSPYRYLTMRRLDLVRQLLAQGQSLVDAAMTAGFTDQSHMTRQFRSTYGMPPSRWVKMLGR